SLTSQYLQFAPKNCRVLPTLPLCMRAAKALAIALPVAAGAGGTGYCDTCDVCGTGYCGAG
ncbi:MAG: hypothetical protein U0L04_02975, partial [Bacteroidaceae bacterium]|nr:hypothetical protein [Bacteroidaceae bacterium]